MNPFRVLVSIRVFSLFGVHACGDFLGLFDSKGLGHLYYSLIWKDNRCSRNWTALSSGFDGFPKVVSFHFSVFICHLCGCLDMIEFLHSRMQMFIPECIHADSSIAALSFCLGFYLFIHFFYVIWIRFWNLINIIYQEVLFQFYICLLVPMYNVRYFFLMESANPLVFFFFCFCYESEIC